MDVQLLIVCSYISTIYFVDGQTQSSTCNTACEKPGPLHNELVGKLYLSCPSHETISITSAIYGRLNKIICPTYHAFSITCSATNAKDKVQFLCGGKKTCSVDAANYVFGDPCVRTEKYLSICYTCIGKKLAVAVNGAWGDWSWWSACTKTCDDGRRQRTRSCNNPRPSNDGRECSGKSTDYELCNIKECAVNGAWGDWSWWSACHETCGNVIRHRRRSCNNPRPSNNGRECSGRSTEDKLCNTPECVINGQWSDWRKWSACSETCGIGRRRRKRSCNDPKPAFGGSRCRGRKFDWKKCNTKKCAVAVNGAWGDWSWWSACTKTCEGGRRQRTRSCNNPRPSNDGRECSGKSTDYELCDIKECALPVNGAWGDWSWWSACTKTCGGGRRRRIRSCNNPTPSNGGRECSGISGGNELCNKQECVLAVNGAWGDWSWWSTCTKTCDGGRRQRTRSCNNPRPVNGGMECSGISTGNELCNTQQCVLAVNGAWGDWSWWSTCTKTCDGGRRQRTRSCNNPRPANGGMECSGISTGNELCNTQQCVYGCEHRHGHWHGHRCYEHEDNVICIKECDKMYKWWQCSRSKNCRRCKEKCCKQTYKKAHGHGHGHGNGHKYGHGSYENGDSAKMYEVINKDKGGDDYSADSAFKKMTMAMDMEEQ